jgi:hypothetical protein
VIYDEPGNAKGRRFRVLPRGKDWPSGRRTRCCSQRGCKRERPADAPRQTIEQVLVEGQEPTEEFVEDWNAVQSAPELSDEEFERQALEAPGEDGDPSTPE